MNLKVKNIPVDEISSEIYSWWRIFIVRFVVGPFIVFLICFRSHINSNRYVLNKSDKINSPCDRLSFRLERLQ